jgi:Cytochrome P450
VWLSDQPLDANEGAFGRSMLVIDVPEPLIVQYEWIERAKGYREFLRGTRIREGDKVVVWFVSGNFDDEVFPEPERFDVGRDPNPHMTFGSGGPHVRIGAHLARLEILVMFEELLPRLSDLEVTGPIARLRSNFINGISTCRSVWNSPAAEPSGRWAASCPTSRRSAARTWQAVEQDPVVPQCEAITPDGNRSTCRSRCPRRAYLISWARRHP